jgi:hypothetical protein
MPRRGLTLCLAVFAITAAILWLPWATQKRTVVASTPVPPALFSVTPAPLPPGSSACMDQVTMDSRSQVVETGVNAGSGKGPPLEVTTSGPGYRATTRVPGGYASTPALTFRITPPDHELLGRICFRNAGKRKISLNGTSEFRTLGRPSLSIDGASQPYDVQLKFYGQRPASYLSQAGAILDHATTFTPGIFGRPLLVLLALLALVGIPLGAFGALAIAAREDEG